MPVRYGLKHFYKAKISAKNLDPEKMGQLQLPTSDPIAMAVVRKSAALITSEHPLQP